MTSMFSRNSMNKTLPDINQYRPSTASNNYGNMLSSNNASNLSFDSNHRRNTFADNDFYNEKNNQVQWADMPLSNNRIDLLKKSYSKPQFDSSFSNPLSNYESFSPNHGRNLQLKLDQKEKEVWKLKMDLDLLKNNELDLVSTINQLKRQLMLLSGGLNSSGGNTNELPGIGDEVFNGLMNEKKDFQDRIRDLEERLKIHLEEKEKTEQEKLMIEKKLLDLVRSLGNLMFIDLNSPLEEFINKLKEVMQENAFLKGTQVNLRDQIKRLEAEDLTNKETIVRLTGEVDKNMQVFSKLSMNLDHAKVDRDRAFMMKEEQEKELGVLKERLENMHKSWSQMRKEFEGMQEVKNNLSCLYSLNEVSKLRWLKDNLISIFTPLDQKMGEEEIIQRINKSLQDLKIIKLDNGKFKCFLENLQLSLEELEKMMIKGSLRKKEELIRIQEILISLKKFLNSTNNFEIEPHKEFREKKMRRILERIGNSLSLNYWKLDVELEMMAEQIENGILELLKNIENESSKREDEVKNRHIMNLQRKVKSMKEIIIKRDAKIESLQEGLGDNSVGDSRLRTAMKLVEKFKLDLNEAHLEIKQLKIKINELSSYKEDSKEKKQLIDNIETELEVYKKQNKKQQNQITFLKQNQQQNSEVFNELTNTKITLERVAQQFKQLYDLRVVIAGMLGVPVSRSAVVDFEIISKLEQLIVQCCKTTNILNNSIVIEAKKSFDHNTKKQDYYEDWTQMNKMSNNKLYKNNYNDYNKKKFNNTSSHYFSNFSNIYNEDGERFFKQNLHRSRSLSPIKRIMEPRIY